MKKIKAKLKKLLWNAYCIAHPLKNIIVLESVPDCSDNTWAVFQEMMKRGLFKQYKLVWRVSKAHSFLQYPNTDYLDTNDAHGRRKYLRYVRCAKCLICCNNFLGSTRKGQFSIYLSHGTALKSVRSYYTVPANINCFLAASKQVVDLQAYEFNCDKAKIVPLGFPRNDVFSCLPFPVKSVLEGEFKKVLLWYPTFRQHKNGLKTESLHALPIIYDIGAAKHINDIAKQSGVLIVIKPHFAQDLTYIKG